jgi:glycosyltransferase 2 family protein
MARKESPIRVLLKPGRIIIPIVIGLGVALFLFIRNFDSNSFSLVSWTWYTSLWIFLALLMMALRDLAYMYRIRVLTNYELSWRKAFDVILLWEFASSVTPSVVGGTPIAIYIVNKEGINLGRTTAIVLITSLLDELFFIIMVPIMYFLLWNKELFPVDSAALFNLKTGSNIIFLTSYFLIVFYCCFISYGIFINPQGIKKLLVKLFHLPVLKKWADGAEKTGNEILLASQEMKGMPASYWIKSGMATFASWTARYLVINCIIAAFVLNADHVLIYGRQLIMWIIMLISPTPGGSGIAEYAFSVYLREFIPGGLSSTLALLWRMVSYYPYLFIGAVLLPSWLQRVYLGRKLIRFKK